MVQILVQLDDKLARDLNKVAPPKDRRRASFIRDAIQQALWTLEERAMALAYKKAPQDSVHAIDSDAFEARPRRSKRSRK